MDTATPELNKKKTLETRKDYARLSAWVREQTKSFKKQLLRIIEKDIRAQFKAENKWVSGTLLDETKTPNEDRAVNLIFFKSFNDTDTIKTWVKQLSERIFKIWDSQLRIAVISKVDMNWVIEQVLGK